MSICYGRERSREGRERKKTRAWVRYASRGESTVLNVQTVSERLRVQRRLARIFRLTRRFHRVARYRLAGWGKSLARTVIPPASLPPAPGLPSPLLPPSCRPHSPSAWRPRSNLTVGNKDTPVALQNSEGHFAHSFGVSTKGGSFSVHGGAISCGNPSES